MINNNNDQNPAGDIRMSEYLYRTQLKNKSQSSGSSDLRKSSIARYSYHEFKQQLDNYDDHNALVYNVIYSRFIEGTHLKKTDELKTLTIGDLRRSSLAFNTAASSSATTNQNENSNNRILSLFIELRRISKSSNCKSDNLSLAFNIKNKSQRKQALRERLEHFYGDVLNIEYRNIQDTHYNIENDFSFPYIIEVAIAEIDTHASFNRRMIALQERQEQRRNNKNNTSGAGSKYEVEEEEEEREYYSLKIERDFGRKILDTINNSPKVSDESKAVITRNIFDHTGYYFEWKNKKGEMDKAGTLSELLNKFGYVTDMDLKNVSINDIQTLILKKKKKLNRIFLINLISPKFYYKTVAKTDINLKPFHSELSELIYKVCIDDDRYFHKQLKKLKGNDGVENVTIISETREFLTERREKVLLDPTIKQTYPLTIRGISYMVKNRLIGKGISAETINPKTISAYIKKIEEEFKMKRDDLGIYTADRAQLYFRGEWHDVNVKSLEALKLMGTDLIVIEKEDIVKALTYYADQTGVALLNTRGYLVEYAELLAKKTECNVVILTDFDIYGLIIAMSQVPEIRRIGIDFETLTFLGLSRDDPTVKDDMRVKGESEDALDEIGVSSSDNSSSIINTTKLSPEEKKKSAERKRKKKIAAFNTARELFKADLERQRKYEPASDAEDSSSNNNNSSNLSPEEKAAVASLQPNKASYIATSEEEVESILDYLSHSRIEINQVLAKVGPAKLWEFILHKLIKLFPYRNYTHAIKTQSEVNELSPIFKEATDYIQNELDTRVLKEDKQNLDTRLEKVKGTLNVAEEEKKITEKYTDVISKDKRLQDIFNMLKRAIEEDKKKASSAAQDEDNHHNDK